MKFQSKASLISSSLALCTALLFAGCGSDSVKPRVDSGTAGQGGTGGGGSGGGGTGGGGTGGGGTGGGGTGGGGQGGSSPDAARDTSADLAVDAGATDGSAADGAVDAAIDAVAADVAVPTDTTTTDVMASDATSSDGATDAAKALSALPTPAEQRAQFPSTDVEKLPIVTGRSAMEHIHSNQLVALWKAAGATRKFKMMPPPRVTGGGSSLYIKPSQYFSITAHSKHPREAALFIDFFTNDIAANDILGGERGVPVNTKVLAALKPKLDPQATEVFDFVSRVSADARGLPRPDPALWDMIRSGPLAKVSQSVLESKSATPVAATALFRTEANAILAGTTPDGGAPADAATTDAATGDAGATTDGPSTDTTAADATTGDASTVDAGPTPVTLNIAWWGSADRHNRTTSVINLFVKKYPHITIYFQHFNNATTEYWPKMRAQAVAGTLPDIMQQDHAFIEEFAGKGYIIPLDGLVTDGSLNLSDVPKALVDGGRVNGKLVAVNLGSNTQAYVIDLDAFAKAGVAVPSDTWTWTQFEQIANEIYTKTGIWGHGAGLHSFTPWKSLYLSAGAWVFNGTNDAIGYNDDTPWVKHLEMIGRLQTP